MEDSNYVWMVFITKMSRGKNLKANCVLAQFSLLLLLVCLVIRWNSPLFRAHRTCRELQHVWCICIILGATADYTVCRQTLTVNNLYHHSGYDCKIMFG